MHRILLLAAAAVFVVSVLMPPSGFGYVTGTPRPAPTVSPSSVTLASEPAPGELSVSLPASLVREGYPSAVWATGAYLNDHLAQTMDQAYAAGVLYDYASSVPVTASMARAGWVLGAPESNQTAAALNASRDAPHRNRQQVMVSGAGVYFFDVPKIIALGVAGVALVAGLIISGKKSAPEVSVRRGGSRR